MDSDIIYKYVDFDTGINKILIDKTIKFTNPTAFNDPFDCDEELISLHIDEEFLSAFINRKLPNKNREEKRKILKGMLINKMQYKSRFFDELQKQKERFRISCFSKTEMEILMWSHYANKHSGICIGFQRSGFHGNPDCAPAEVKYFDKYITYRYDIDNLEAFKGWITTKYEKWSYEEEVRLINNKKIEIISFEQELVKEVVFGCKVKQSEIIQAIQDLKTDGYNKIEFYKMVKEKNRFNLNKEILNL